MARASSAEIGCNTFHLTGSRSAQYLARSNKTVDQLLEDVFDEGLGTIRPFAAKFSVRSDATPKFCKARSVPYALREGADEQLDKLEAKRILEKVNHSEWAAPIVTVPKKDGTTRICGDYKVTINSMLEIDQYPLPKPEDLFATLAGGKKFMTLDLSYAYNQTEVDECSWKYVTINTHRGLYRYRRLPFGVASAPAIFQKTMDTILQGMSKVTCYLNDTLITDITESEHLSNLEEVLRRLQEHGVHLHGVTGLTERGYTLQTGNSELSQRHLPRRISRSYVRSSVY